MLTLNYWKCSFLSYFIKQTDLTLLDVGCGGMEISHYFVDKGMLVQGIDKRPQENYKEGFTFLQSDLNKQWPDILDNSFDVVISTQFLEHIENPVLQIQQMFRVTKRLLLLSFPVGRSFFDPTHIHFWHDFKHVDDLLVEALKENYHNQKYEICKGPTKVEDVKNGQRNWLVAIEKKVSDE